MKKVLLAMFAMAVGVSAYGQSQSPGGQLPGEKGYIPSPVRVQDMHSSVPSRKLGKRDFDGWYNWLDAASASQIITFQGFSNTTLYPDSTVKQIYGDGNGGTQLGYVGLHAVGQVFDPKSGYFTDDENQGIPPSLSRYTKYNVDSVAAFFQYYRPVDTVEDKLLFQFYTSKTGGGVVKSTLQTTPPDPTAYVRYNLLQNKGTGAEKEYSYTLSSDDTDTAGYKSITVPTGGILVPADGLFAFTVVFQPGQTAELGDTIDNRWEPAPTKKLNHMKVGVYHDNANSNHESYNHSLRVSTPIRYGKVGPEQWGGSFVPGDAWLTYNSYFLSSFYVSATNIGLNEAFEGYALGDIYPNPAQSVATIDFSLGNTENVNVYITDIAGRQVSQLASGQYSAGVHKLNLNTADMKPGIYFYTMTAGNYVQTNKFVVSR